MLKIHSVAVRRDYRAPKADIEPNSSSKPGPASLPLLDDDSDFPTLDSEAVASLVSFNSSPTVQTYQETATSSKEPTKP